MKSISRSLINPTYSCLFTNFSPMRDGYRRRLPQSRHEADLFGIKRVLDEVRPVRLDPLDHVDALDRMQLAVNIVQ